MTTTILVGSGPAAIKTPPSSVDTDHHPVTDEDERGIGVAVRVRPLSTQELSNSSIGYGIQCLKQSIVIGDSSGTAPVAKGLGSARNSLKPRQFEVDKVYHQHSTQKQVYEECCRSIVAGLFEGTNGAVLAYGATGSGKTHTMFGGQMSSGGIVYQTVQDIFEEKLVLEEEEGKNVVVKCSFIEIYNENVFDLLAPPKKFYHVRTPSGTQEILQISASPVSTFEAKVAPWVNGRPALPVREGAKTSGEACNPEPLHIPGLTYVYPNSAEEFAQAIEKGRSNRFVACTAANPQSSRSHAIITIEVHVSGGVDAFGHPCPGTVARIRLCDLAGSERAASSSNSGIRLREGGNINRSLLALGSVVQSLLQKKQSSQKQVFIPYRGSCLTRLLKDSIGGNCRTQMIFCLNPSTKQLEESINTMLFAMKARQIEVTAHRNVYKVNSEAVAKSQELLIDELRHQISLYEEEMRKLGVSPRECFAQKSCGGRRLFSHTVNSCSLRDSLSVHEILRHDNELSSSSDASEVNEMEPKSMEIHTSSEPSPVPVRTPLLRQKKKKSVSMDVTSPQFVQVETKLRDLMTEKESQYWRNREAKERIVARDLQLRELKWKLARFLASNELGVRLRGDPGVTSGGTVVTPVGVAGMRNTIAAVEEEQAQALKDVESMMTDIDQIDRQIEAIRNDLPHDKNQGVLELLFENMKLRQNCTEAEHLASDYHQECRQKKGRINEYQEALSVCVSALHSVIPHLPHNSAAMADAKLALFYANLPHAQTEKMIQVFESSLKADSTPPLVPSVVGSSSPSKRHQRSHSGDDLLVAIQDLEHSFHSFTSSPPHRNRSRGSILELNDNNSNTRSEVALSLAPATASSHLVVRGSPREEASKTRKPQPPESRDTSVAVGSTNVPLEKSSAEKKKSEMNISPSKNERENGKLAHFTRFYSSTNHLSASSQSSSSSFTRPEGTSRPVNATPTRRRRDPEKTEVGLIHSVPSSAAHPVRVGVASPMRSQKALERKRPATAASYISQRCNGLRGATTRSLGVVHQQQQHAASLLISPPRVVTHAIGSAAHHQHHPVVIEESTKSSPIANRSKIRIRGDNSPGAASLLFQRSSSAPVHPPPAKTRPALMTPSIPGLAKATPAPKIAPPIVKKAPRTVSAPSVENEKQGVRREGGHKASPVTNAMSAKHVDAVYGVGVPTSPVRSISVLSVDDMQVSRSTFSDADEMDELSSTFSQFTPREALCGLR